MISLVESPEEDFDEVLVPPVLLSVPLPSPLLMLDGELDDAVCVAVTPPPRVTDGDFDVTDGFAVGPESATCATTIVEVVVGVPGSMVPALDSWLQVSSIAAIPPLKRAEHWLVTLYQSNTPSCVPHEVSWNATS